METTKAEDWISIKEAASLLLLSYSLVYRLREDIDPMNGEPYLRSWQPSRGVILISKADAQRLKKETQADPDFWRSRRGVVWIPFAGANGLGKTSSNAQAKPLQTSCATPIRQANVTKKPTRQLQPSAQKASKPPVRKAPSVIGISAKSKNR